jgi:hypothetical protein
MARASCSGSARGRGSRQTFPERDERAGVEAQLAREGGTPLGGRSSVGVFELVDLAEVDKT